MLLHTQTTRDRRFSPGNLSPQVEHAVRRLVRYTKRSAVILDLLQVPRSLQDRVQRSIDRALTDLYPDGVKRPRGAPPAYDSRAFLESTHDRFEASVLLALHRRLFDTQPSTPAGPSAPSEDPIERIHATTAVYGRYLASRHNGSDGALSFDLYLELLNAVRHRVVGNAKCTTCGTRHVFSVLRTTSSQVSCPFCARYAAMAERMKSVRSAEYADRGSASRVQGTRVASA